MSYKAPVSTGDSLNDYFSRLSDFTNIAPRLLHADTKEGFEVWFEKLELIDKRSLYFFIKEHKDEIPKEYLKMVQDRFPKKF